MTPTIYGDIALCISEFCMISDLITLRSVNSIFTDAINVLVVSNKDLPPITNGIRLKCVPWPVSFTKRIIFSSNYVFSGEVLDVTFCRSHTTNESRTRLHHEDTPYGRIITIEEKDNIILAKSRAHNKLEYRCFALGITHSLTTTGYMCKPLSYNMISIVVCNIRDLVRCLTSLGYQEDNLIRIEPMIFPNCRETRLLTLTYQKHNTFRVYFIIHASVIKLCTKSDKCLLSDNTARNKIVHCQLTYPKDHNGGYILYATPGYHLKEIDDYFDQDLYYGFVGDILDMF